MSLSVKDYRQSELKYIRQRKPGLQNNAGDVSRCFVSNLQVVDRPTRLLTKRQTPLKTDRDGEMKSELSAREEKKAATQSTESDFGFGGRMPK